MRRRRGGLLKWGILALFAWAIWRLLRAPDAAPVPRPEPVAPETSPIMGARMAPPPARRRPMPPARRRAGAGVRPAVLGAAALAMLVVGVAAAGVRGDGLLGASEPVEPTVGLLRIGEPLSLGVTTTWAPVLRATRARALPEAGAAPVGRLATRTPEGTRNLVVVTDPTPSSSTGGAWVRVRMPGAGELGWVARSSLGRFSRVYTEAVVDLTRRTFTLARRGRVVFQAPAGVGTPGAPTPTGEFYVRNRITQYRGAFYGPLAFGLSARARGLSDWPAGGAIGIHGTNRPQLVPGAVSRASIRLRNPDLRRLARLMPVGTPVTII